jgi:hypothetical protein
MSNAKLPMSYKHYTRFNLTLQDIGICWKEIEFGTEAAR